ncbi:glycosyltransferase family 4 protein [Erysipelothrix tonsillarum]|uniref:glycosyltransferase family 4 protein n=1 Tax=Erysipelothrix tonsillarum TaxID=38402 RepID=UPI00037CFC14|nr:glycosyltransferase family 4 protein [Erysipelothrix tonsillarum]
MKILYLSSTNSGMHRHSIYFDLLTEFKNNGHDVTIVYAREKRLNQATEYYDQFRMHYLGVKTGNLTKNSNLIDKGIATLRIDSQFKRAIKKHLSHETFDLVLYSTPPITLLKTVKYLKTKNPDSVLYLMLKDIFPQNAVDLGFMKQNGPIHRFFSFKERKLYTMFDVIGTMSPANLEYMKKQHPSTTNKLEILPNALAINPDNTLEEPVSIRETYSIRDDQTILLYGGNLGAPQAIPFVIECIDRIKNDSRIIFLIAGSGAKADMITSFIQENNISNTLFLGQLESKVYNSLASQCDIGLIYLDYRFTIPNYPQRLLTYLEAAKPIVCATDVVTDIGKIAEANNYGMRVESNDVEAWYQAVDTLVSDSDLRKKMGANGHHYLMNHYTVAHAYNIIIKHMGA